MPVDSCRKPAWMPSNWKADVNAWRPFVPLLVLASRSRVTWV